MSVRNNNDRATAYAIATRVPRKNAAQPRKDPRKNAASSAVHDPRVCSECDEHDKPMMPEGNEKRQPCCVECWVGDDAYEQGMGDDE